MTQPPRRASRFVAAALVAAGLLAGGCSLTDDATGGGAGPGTLVTAETAPPQTYVELPFGRLNLSLHGPTRDLPTYDEEVDHAADGASFVGVGWSVDTGRWPESITEEASAPEPSLALVVEGRRYPLDEAMLRSRGDDPDPDAGPLEYWGTAWQAVEGDPDELSTGDMQVEVTYDGVTQTADFGDPGWQDDSPARAAYNPSMPLQTTRGECGELGLPRGYRAGQTTSCRVTVGTTAWRQGLGWAKAGELWTVVEVDLYLPTLQQPSAYWTVGELRPTYRLGGRAPVAPPEETVPERSGPTEGSVHQTVIFSGVPQGDLVVETELGLVPSTGTGPGRTERLRVVTPLY